MLSETLQRQEAGWESSRSHDDDTSHYREHTEKERLNTLGKVGAWTLRYSWWKVD
jgi:hypothetical protein